MLQMDTEFNPSIQGILTFSGGSTIINLCLLFLMALKTCQHYCACIIKATEPRMFNKLYPSSPSPPTSGEQL